MAGSADIEYTERENPETGRMQKCVIATCVDSNEESMAWGQGTGSVRRALAGLSECDCGQSYHEATKGEDDD